MGCLLKEFGGSLTKFRIIMATKGQTFALCHLKHWIFIPPADRPTLSSPSQYIPCTNTLHGDPTGALSKKIVNQEKETLMITNSNCAYFAKVPSC